MFPLKIFTYSNFYALYTKAKTTSKYSIMIIAKKLKPLGLDSLRLGKKRYKSYYT